MTGSIVRADNSGLGTLARDFYDHGIVNKVLIFPNGVYRSFPERFPNSRMTTLITDQDIEWLFEGIDRLIFFETPFRWDILSRARAKGIRTIIIPMHEGLPDTPPENPDLWVCPSSLEMKLDVQPKVFLPIPVNTERIRWKRRKTAQIFVHNTGHGGIQFRNGTIELLEAIKYVKSDIRLIIRSQYHQFVSSDPRVEIRYQNVRDYWDLWEEGDVFIFPEKFNGLSLPIQEAVASGMMVMATRRHPFDEWLPREPLIKAAGFFPFQVTRSIECARIDPLAIARKIDEFAGTDITIFSNWGKRWAEENSWQSLRAKYESL